MFAFGHFEGQMTHSFPAMSGIAAHPQCYSGSVEKNDTTSRITRKFTHLSLLREDNDQSSVSFVSFAMDCCNRLTRFGSDEVDPAFVVQLNAVDRLSYLIGTSGDVNFPNRHNVSLRREFEPKGHTTVHIGHYD